MPKKTLEEYIEQYGEDSGTKRYNGVLKSEAAKKEKYSKQPYKRLTKEWYIWRYGEDEGFRRYSEFVRKSTHRLEVFIEKYGEEEGTRKYNETMSKKNTREHIRNTNPENAEDIIAGWDKKKSEGQRIFWDSLSDIDRKNNINNKISKMNQTKMERYGAIDSHSIVKAKYGEEAYLEYKKKLFPTVPGQASKWSLKLIDKILEGVDLGNAIIYYGCSEKGLSEYHVFDNIANRGYRYDLVIEGRNGKLCVEFDGAGYHPTKEQVDESPNSMTLGKVTFKEQYDLDQRKEEIIKSYGFSVIRIRDDEKLADIDDIIMKIKEIINDII